MPKFKPGDRVVVKQVLGAEDSSWYGDYRVGEIATVRQSHDSNYDTNWDDDMDNLSYSPRVDFDDGRTSYVVLELELDFLHVSEAELLFS